MSIVKQLSMSGGELCPAMYSRTDQAKYATGLRTMRNTYVMRHGGGSNRAGTSYVGLVRTALTTSVDATRFIPFIFNADQTYVLEFGAATMRVIKNGAYLANASQAITGITNANPCVITYSGADTFATDDVIYLSGIQGAVGRYLNGRDFKVGTVNSGANTFTLKYYDGTAVNSTAFGAYGSAGTINEYYQIATPYSLANVRDLQFTQSADIVTIVHPSYAPYELARTGDISWTLTALTFSPAITAPTGVAVSGASGSVEYWAVTTIAQETYEESLASSEVGANAVASTGSPRTITWNPVSGAQEYNVYKKKNGVFGFIGIAGSTSFIDDGIDADTTDTPPVARNPFSGAGNYPATVNYIQQRLSFASSDNDPEKVWMSRTGFFKNFTISSPLQDDDAVTFTMAGKQVNQVEHLLDLGTFLVLTNGGEHVVQGDSAGIIRPGEINKKQSSYNGSAGLAPIVIGGTAFYVQARGTIIRDLTYQFESDGYRGSDLTIFSTHLFDGYSIIDWAYQQIPNSILWVVRSDGALLGLTYIREQSLAGWHRHDFQGGRVESICVVPEGLEDAVYVSVWRLIDGVYRLHLERLNTRFVDDVVDNIFMDSALTYDGRNAGATTMTLSGSTTWAYDEELVITASATTFLSSDVGNAIHFTADDGEPLRVVITGYTSGTIAAGKPHRTVPAELRSAPTTDWFFAVDEVTGLWHLEGEEVSIFADGLVDASPNNPAYTVKTVTNGAVTLDNTHSVIHVGLPYISDIQTLNIDTVQSETLVDKKTLITSVTIETEKTRGIFAGNRPPTDDDDDPIENLYELKIRNLEGYDEPVDLLTGKAKIDINSTWNDNGRVFLRQVDPLPMTILSISPSGLIPFKG